MNKVEKDIQHYRTKKYRKWSRIDEGFRMTYLVAIIPFFVMGACVDPPHYGIALFGIAVIIAGLVSAFYTSLKAEEWRG